MNRKKIQEPAKQMSAKVPLRHRQMVNEIQAWHGDISLSQIWRKALDIGLAQLMKEIPKEHQERK